jgi:hypothetical protein
MPEKRTTARAKRDKRQGKSASTQAGEYVREEVKHVREGKHGARSAKQAIAIGLSKARRAGVKLPSRPGAKASTKKRTGAKNPRRARAASKALKREGRAAGSRKALSRQAKGASKRRSAASRSASAKKAARTRARNRR